MVFFYFTDFFWVLLFVLSLFDVALKDVIFILKATRLILMSLSHADSRWCVGIRLSVVIVTFVCLGVCVCLHSWAISTINLVPTWSVAETRHALTLRSKNQSSSSLNILQIWYENACLRPKMFLKSWPPHMKSSINASPNRHVTACIRNKLWDVYHRNW